MQAVSDWLAEEQKALTPKDHGTIFAGTSQLLDLSKGFLKDIDAQLDGELAPSRTPAPYPHTHATAPPALRAARMST